MAQYGTVNVTARVARIDEATGEDEALLRAGSTRMLSRAR
jgi:hypothetical protein